MRKSNITAKSSIIINESSATVWEALTTPEIIKQYFFGTDTVSTWKIGGPIFFSGEWQGKKYQDKGTIVNMVPNKLFKYNYWSSMSGMEDKPENYVDITYELSGKNGTTMLTITQENVPDENMKEHSEQNWNKVLTDLKVLLEKNVLHS